MECDVLDAGRARSRLRGRFGRLARAASRMRVLLAERDQKMDAVRRRYAGGLARLQDSVDALTLELEAICRRYPAELLPQGRRSLVTAHGELGFRRCEGAIRLLEGVSEDEAAGRLRLAGLGDLVRTRSAPDRRALRRAVSRGRVDAADLGRLGFELAGGGDRFYCKVRHEPAPTVVGGRKEPR